MSDKDLEMTKPSPTVQKFFYHLKLLFPTYFNVLFYVLLYKSLDDSVNSFPCVLLKIPKDDVVRKKIPVIVNYYVCIVHSAPIGLYFCDIKEKYYT